MQQSCFVFFEIPTKDISCMDYRNNCMLSKDGITEEMHGDQQLHDVAFISTGNQTLFMQQIVWKSTDLYAVPYSHVEYPLIECLLNNNIASLSSLVEDYSKPSFRKIVKWETLI